MPRECTAINVIYIYINAHKYASMSMNAYINDPKCP